MKRIRLKSLDHLEFFAEKLIFATYLNEDLAKADCFTRIDSAFYSFTIFKCCHSIVSAYLCHVRSCFNEIK